MKRDSLQATMARRSPLTPREPVSPVDLYTEGDADHSPGPSEIHRETNTQTDKAVSQHVHTETNQQISRVDGTRRRYTTYLKPETIKAIKWLAVDGERNDYEIVQEALDAYLTRCDGSQ